MTDSQKIKNIIEELINTKKVKNRSDFCAQIGYATGNLSKIENGGRKIPASLKMVLIEKFEINKEFLSNDKLPILQKKEEKNNESVDDDLVTLAHKLLERLDKKHDAHIIDLQKNNDNLIKTSEAFVDTSRVLGRIVDMCLDAGAITVDRSKVVEVYYNPGCQHAYRLLYPHNFLHIQFNTGLPTDTFKDQSPNNPVTYTRIARGRSIFIECFSEVSYGISDSSCSCGLTVKVDGVLKYSTHNGIEKTIDIYK